MDIQDFVDMLIDGVYQLQDGIDGSGVGEYCTRLRRCVIDHEASSAWLWGEHGFHITLQDGKQYEIAVREVKE